MKHLRAVKPYHALHVPVVHLRPLTELNVKIVRDLEIEENLRIIDGYGWKVMKFGGYSRETVYFLIYLPNGQSIQEFRTQFMINIVRPAARTLPPNCDTRNSNAAGFYEHDSRLVIRFFLREWDDFADEAMRLLNEAKENGFLKAFNVEHYYFYGKLTSTPNLHAFIDII